jgi:hypothetical protein
MLFLTEFKRFPHSQDERSFLGSPAMLGQSEPKVQSLNKGV